MSDIDMEESSPPPDADTFPAELLDDLDDADPDDDQAAEDIVDESPRLLFPHLREISSLASWIVSSHKPGSGVAALRSPSVDSFWQSDGPQPHTLTLHFARRVKLAYMRLHVNHEQDESYTPTKIQIWAGTGYHDLLQVTEMNLEAPKGWLAVDLSNAGGPSEFSPDEGPYELASEAGEDLGNSEDDEAMMAQHMAEGSALPPELVYRRQKRRRLRLGRGPTLRCFLVQVRILENHQNGKDTHLRGFQVFAKDHEAVVRRQQEDLVDDKPMHAPTKSHQSKQKSRSKQQAAMDRLATALRQPAWMDVPELR